MDVQQDRIVAMAAAHAEPLVDATDAYLESLLDSVGRDDPAEFGDRVAGTTGRRSRFPCMRRRPGQAQRRQQHSAHPLRHAVLPRGLVTRDTGCGTTVAADALRPMIRRTRPRPPRPSTARLARIRLIQRLD